MLKSGPHISSACLKLLQIRNGCLILKVGDSLPAILERDHQRHLWLCRCGFSTTSAKQQVGYKLKNNISDCYSLLNTSEDSSDNEIREAYLKLAKVYHPDAGASTADSRKFNQIQEAYKAIKRHRSQGPNKEDEEEEDDDLGIDIKHTVPQHRQYLTFEGVGFGTPVQRQKQYQQYKVSKATEKVYQHRVSKWTNKREDAVVVRNKKEAKKIKTSSAIERLVEDLIQEAMQKGDFDNLSGTGKPLNYTERNPLVDTTTHNINKILINNGYAPEWIMLEKEIRENIKKARARLAAHIQKYGLPPFEVQSDTLRWNVAMEKFTRAIENVNLLIDKFNMIVPFVDKQLIPLTVARETRRVSNNVEKYFMEIYDDTEMSLQPISIENSSFGIGWKEIWKNIKDIFR